MLLSVDFCDYRLCDGFKIALCVDQSTSWSHWSGPDRVHPLAVGTGCGARPSTAVPWVPTYLAAGVQSDGF